MIRHLRAFKLAVLSATTLLVAGCATPNSSPARPQVTAAERSQAAQQHPALLEQFGGAYAGGEAAYLARIGEKVAAAAGLSGQCTFTLVNTDVVNAFAVPGCYIYLTRGLFGLVNSEAELASVLAHEVGHVVADHSERRQNRSLLTGLGSLAVGVLTGSGELAQAAGQLGQVYTLSYSRGQEFEADDLAVRYLIAAGYNPYSASDMLESLQDHDRLQQRARGREEAGAIPEWARTHPLTGNRIARATKQAAATGLAPGALPDFRDAYLDEVDGLLYGDDPAQGFIIGRRFAHPELRVAFEAPSGYTLTNNPQAVLIEGPGGVRGRFGAGQVPAGGLDAYAGQLLQSLLGNSAGAAAVGTAERTRVNGLETVLLPAQARTANGVVDIMVVAYAAGSGRAYHFITLAPASANVASTLGALFRSVRTLGVEEARTLRPRRIQVVRVEPSSTIQRLSAQMACDAYCLETFLTLNDLAPDQPLRAGERVKLVRYEGQSR